MIKKIDTFPFIPKKKKSIVIIGAGGIVRDAHLPAYKKAGFEVRALFDIDIKKAEKLANDFGIKIVCAQLIELIEEANKNECIYDIALPASELLSVLSLIPDGSGILIQKPMGENILQANAILELCRNKKFIAGINLQLRHAPYIVAAKKIIEKGLIGEIHDIDVRLNVNTPWHLWNFMLTIERLEILYHSIHYLDMIRYFIGEPHKVYAKTTKHPNSPGLEATRSAIIMDYGEMIRANINTNHGHNFGLKHQESYFKFEGTEGAIKIKVGVYLNYPKGEPDQFEYFSLKENAKGWQNIDLEGSWFPDAFIGPMAGLMKKLEDPNYEYINSVEDAIHTMRLVEDCYLSSG